MACREEPADEAVWAAQVVWAAQAGADGLEAMAGAAETTTRCTVFLT